jgi:hypothetical protein
MKRWKQNFETDTGIKSLKHIHFRGMNVTNCSTQPKLSVVKTVVERVVNYKFERVWKKAVIGYF